MIAPANLRPRSRLEAVDANVHVTVDDHEYWRLLGYPKNREPSDRARELAAQARTWFAGHGQPWTYYRELEVKLDGGRLRLDGVEFQSEKLIEHFSEFRVQRAIAIAVSAGRACEEYARDLWQCGKPDEYFFTEMYGSAVVERLIVGMNATICDVADREQLAAIPHYSPGYTGWDVAEQNRLYDIVIGRSGVSLPESLEVLDSGMLRPKKSLLGVIGLAPRERVNPARGVPCEQCAYSPCQYRRANYRHARNGNTNSAASKDQRASRLTVNAKYSVNPRALEKWSRERVRLNPRPDGKWEAAFRFDGTTCSNQGRPLAFDYKLLLGSADERYTIIESECCPAEGDAGFESMCAYLSDPDGLMHSIASEKPLLGRSLDDILKWSRAAAPSGCYCTADSRIHKWGLALEAIHYTLSRTLREKAT